MTRKITLGRLRLIILLALSCFSYAISYAQPVTCSPAFADCLSGKYISEIKYENMDLTATQTGATTGCQVVQRHDTANVCPGTADSMTIFCANSQMTVAVFIDTNRDGIFEGNEFFYGNYDPSLGGKYVFPIPIPLTQRPGLYPVRAIGAYESGPDQTPAVPPVTLSAVDSCSQFVDGSVYGQLLGFGAYYEFTIRVLDSLKITSQPVATFGCPGLPLSLTVGTSGTGLSFQWYKNDTLIAGATHATFTIPHFAKSDSGYYFAIIHNQCATDTTDSVQVYMHSVPTVAVTTFGPTTFCPGGQVRFRGNDSIGFTHHWLYNGGLLADTTRRDTAYQPGVYKYIVNNGCPDTSAAINVAWFPISTPIVSPAGLTKKCATATVAQNTVNFVTPQGTGVKFNWQRNTGIPNVYTNIGDTLNYVSTNTAGSYQVIMTDSNGCITQSLPSVLQENLPAIVNITTQASPFLCAGGYITLLASSTDTGEKYVWQYNGSNIQGPITTASYNAYNAGNYSVVGNNGCAVTSAAFNVTTIPFPNVITSGPLTFCGTGSALLTSSVTSPTLNYQWQKNGVDIPGATGTQYNAQDSGAYSVVVISNNTCTAGSTAVTLTYNPLPVPAIEVGADQITLTVAPNYHSYQWYRNDTLIPAPAGTLASYIAHVAATYKVSVTDDNGCTGTSAGQITLGDKVSVSTVNAASVSVYPNPATSLVRIMAPVSVNVTLNAIDGRTVLTQKNAKEINIQDLADGVYTMHITDKEGNTIKVEKLVKSSN